MSEEEKKEIENFKKYIKNATPFDMSPSRYNMFETILNLTEKQQKELELKDKVIEEMAKEMYKKRDISKCINPGCDGIECEECIKQYFINKVKENK